MLSWLQMCYAQQLIIQESDAGPLVLPSIATSIDPASSIIWIVCGILRTISIVSLWFSRLVRRTGVANMSIIHHDGRLLAICYSGPPIRVFLSLLHTV
jgi:hypothetical protein